MNSAEFLALANANQTSQVRVYSQKWGSIHSLPNEIASHIGSIMNFLQMQIEQGQFCKKDEYLLLYNFQALQVEESAYLCSLDILIKPLSTLHQTDVLLGKPFQLVLNGTTGEVMNDAKALIEMGLSPEEDEQENENYPISFGHYTALDTQKVTPETLDNLREQSLIKHEQHALMDRLQAVKAFFSELATTPSSQNRESSIKQEALDLTSSAFAFETLENSPKALGIPPLQHQNDIAKEDGDSEVLLLYRHLSNTETKVSTGNNRSGRTGLIQ